MTGNYLKFLSKIEAITILHGMTEMVNIGKQQVIQNHTIKLLMNSHGYQQIVKSTMVIIMILDGCYIINLMKF